MMEQTNRLSAVEAVHDGIAPSLPHIGFRGFLKAAVGVPHRGQIRTFDLRYLRFSAATTRLCAVRGAGRRLGARWGALTEFMAVQEPAGSLGIHTMPATVPAKISRALAQGEAPPADLTTDERNAWNQPDFFNKNGLGYAIEINNRSQTLYEIVDSPVDLAAWTIDHDARIQEMIGRRVFDGKTEGLTRDDVLDNVTLYWLTNTAISSARLYSRSRRDIA